MHTRPGYWFISSLTSWARLGPACDAAIAAKMASAVHRPVYYGVVVYEYDPAPVVIVDVHHDGCWPPGHCKHHGHGGHGKWKKGKGKWH